MTVMKERRRRGIAPFQPTSEPVEWTEDMIALLGTETDADVAELLGIGESSVRLKRRLLHIEAFGDTAHGRAKVTWTQEHLDLLGRVPDAVLAARMGISGSTVWMKRHLAGIPPFRERPARVKWTRAMKADVNRLSQKEFTRRYGVSVIAVNWYRVKHGLMRGRLLHRWEPKDLELVGRLTDQAVADRLGVSSGTVKRKRAELGRPPVEKPVYWTPESEALLGTMTDRALAKRLGCSPALVCLRRKALGRAKYPRPGTIEWTPEKDALLGTDTDEAVGARLGCGKMAAFKRRKKLKKPAFAKR